MVPLAGSGLTVPRPGRRERAYLRSTIAGGGTNGGQAAGCYTDTTGVRGPHRGAEIYDLSNGSRWGVIPPMLYPRKEHSGTMLPDGTVFVSGGHFVDDACCPPACPIEGTFNVANTPVLPCELFDPSDSTWTEMDALNWSYGRKYHSFALLLPDGRVLTAGNQNVNGVAGAGQDYEIFYPPYMFKSGPTLRTTADRPEVVDAPSAIEYGFPFFVEFDHVADPGAVEACLIAPTAATHGNNMTQRRVLLNCEPVTIDSETVLAVTAPWEPEIAPPGYYLLFLLEDGIPSEAAWVKLQQPADYVVGDGETELWAGTVHLDRDFTVEEGGTLRILPGTDIFAWADRDSTPSGDGKTRVTVQGSIRAEGTATDPIKFTSHLSAGSPTTLDWDGLWFELAGVERTSYGYVWCLGATDYCDAPADSCVTSLLKHVTIENAAYGVAISSMRAPSLDSLSFSNIEEDRHIYLDRADVVVSVDPCAAGGSGYDYWTLLPGTHVVASNDVNPSAQMSYGDDELVELIFLGQVILPGPSSPSGSPGDSVYFRPETVTVSDNVTNGDDWGGLMIFNKHASGLKYADIGYAKVPVFIYSPFASVSVQNSRIHHFADTGVWLAGGAGEAVGITGCVITRDEGTSPFLNPQQDAVGIHLDSRDHASISQNVVGLTGLESGSGIGIDVEYSSGLCQSTPSTGRTLVIQDNVVVGPYGEAGAYSGIRLQDVCGSVYRDIDLVENDVEGWSYAGFEIKQSAAVQVSCNRSELNGRGVEVIRTTTTSNPVRFRHNTFRALAQNANLHAVGTNKVSGTAIGANTSTTGENRITAYQTDTKLARNTDTTGLDATDNAWYKNTDGGEQTTDTLLDSQTEIDNRLAGSVDASDFLTSAPSWSCTTPDTCLTCTSGMVQSGAVALAPDAPVPGATAPRGTPLVRELGPAVPNPSRGIVDLALAIPARDTGRYTLDVFDAAGRRVFSKGVEVSSAGRYTLQWSGRDGADRRVSAGVFFLRVKGPSFSELRKVVLVQ